MKVLLTGATGFIGKQTAKELVKRGHGVTCLVRENSEIEDLKLIPAHFVKGDVRNYQSLMQAMPGHDAVIHTAAVYKFGPVDKKEMHETNIKGTENVLLAAVKLKTNKVIYCGSTIALGDTKGQKVDEKWTRRAPFYSEYEKTKFLAHQKAISFIKKGAPVVIAMPSHVYGPGDKHGFATFIQKYINGELPVGLNVPYKASYVHVGDVAKGLVDSLEKGRNGESYILAGEEVAWEEFFFLLENYSGVSRPAVDIGLKTSKLLAYATNIVSKILKKTPKVSVESVNQLNKSFIFKNDKAKIELGWIPRPFSKGFKETIESYKKELVRA